MKRFKKYLLWVIVALGFAVVVVPTVGEILLRAMIYEASETYATDIVAAPEDVVLDFGGRVGESKLRKLAAEGSDGLLQRVIMLYEGGKINDLLHTKVKDPNISEIQRLYWSYVYLRNMRYR